MKKKKQSIFITSIYQMIISFNVVSKASGLKFLSPTLQDDKFQPIHWSLQKRSMIYEQGQRERKKINKGGTYQEN